MDLLDLFSTGPEKNINLKNRLEIMKNKKLKIKI